MCCPPGWTARPRPTNWPCWTVILPAVRACTDFASSLTALDRVTRLTPAEPVPDLAGAVMAANPPVRRDPRREAARWSLVVVALAQLVIALPSLLDRPER